MTGLDFKVTIKIFKQKRKFEMPNLLTANFSH